MLRNVEQKDPKILMTKTLFEVDAGGSVALSLLKCFRKIKSKLITLAPVKLKLF